MPQSVCLRSRFTTVFLLAKSSHYAGGLHPRFALSVRILPVRHFTVRSLQITKLPLDVSLSYRTFHPRQLTFIPL